MFRSALPENETPAGWWNSRWFLAALVLISAVPLLYPTVPPLTDLPEHMGRYRIQLSDPASPLRTEYFDFHWAFIANLGVDLLIVPMAALFGLELGVKLIVIAIVMLTITGMLWIAREAHGRVPPPALCVYESHPEFAERIGAAEHGVDSLTASYLPATPGTYAGSTSSAVAHTITKAATTTTVALTPSSVAYGTRRVLKATVARVGGGLAVPGNVTLTKSGAPLKTLALSGGSASLVLPATLPVGKHAFGASFAGTGDLLPSTAAARSLTVVKANSKATAKLSKKTAKATKVPMAQPDVRALL